MKKESHGFDLAVKLVTRATSNEECPGVASIYVIDLSLRILRSYRRLPGLLLQPTFGHETSREVRILHAYRSPTRFLSCFVLVWIRLQFSPRLR